MRDEWYLGWHAAWLPLSVAGHLGIFVASRGSCKRQVTLLTHTEAGCAPPASLRRSLGQGVALSPVHIRVPWKVREQ